MKGYLVVFLGAGLGGMARHAVNAAAMRLGGAFPWHTLTINVVGSLLMGVLIGWRTSDSIVIGNLFQTIIEGT